MPPFSLISRIIQQLFLLALKEGIFVADVIVGDSVSKTLQISFALLMTVATPLVFQSLLEFVIMISNPFGNDWIDFPTLLWHKQIRDEVLDLVKVGEFAANLPTVKAAKAIPSA